MSEARKNALCGKCCGVFEKLNCTPSIWSSDLVKVEKLEMGWKEKTLNRINVESCRDLKGAVTQQGREGGDSHPLVHSPNGQRPPGITLAEAGSWSFLRVSPVRTGAQALRLQ